MTRQSVVLWAGIAFVAAAFCTGSLLGPSDIALRAVFGILVKSLGFGGVGEWKTWQEMVVMDVRLPRTVLGLLVGGGLAVSGAAMQGFFRNPLAEPGIVGVSSGAAFGGVVSIYTGLSAQSAWMLPAFTFLGGMGATYLVYVITARQGRIEPNTLLLAGVALSVLFVAMTSFVISVSLANWQVAAEILNWTMGGLSGRNWDHVKLAAPVVLTGCAAILVHGRDLDALVMGETQAFSVGVNVPAVRRNLILATSAVTGATVAVAGPIGFVGLVVPHVLRLSIGPGHRWLLPASGLFGAAFLVFADMGCRLITQPEETQLGIVTALAGAPLFVFMLLRRRNVFQQ